MPSPWLRERLVHERLQGEVGAAPVAAVGRDDQLGLGVVDALAQALGAEAAKDHRVDGADARAGEHRDHGFGDLGQVDRDAVALGDAERLEAAGGLLDALQHVGVGEGLGVAGLAHKVEGDAVAAALAHVAVHGVVARVEGAVVEPAGHGGVGPVEDLGEGLVPGEAQRGLAPILQAVGLGLLVFVAGRVGVRGHAHQRREDPLLGVQVLEGVAGRRVAAGDVGIVDHEVSL